MNDNSLGTMTSTRPLLHGEITDVILRSFYRVYDALGHGFLESVYANTLDHELRAEGLDVAREFPIDVWYRGTKVGHFRADLLVQQRVIVELKAGQALVDADKKQMLNYLRGTNVEVGLLLHFGPKANFHRMIFDNTRKGSLKRSADVRA